MSPHQRTIKYTGNSSQKGETLVFLLVILFIFSLVMMPVIQGVTLRIQSLRTTVQREQALQIAEAGINYYQWHLAHYPNDYMDGSTSTGPYVHTYVDTDSQTVLGTYSLVITPPVAGSTIVKIQSTGYSAQNPNVKRTITATYGIPSLAQYSFLSNDIMWIGPNEQTSGQVYSNNGIRFDGSGNGPIQSAKATYTCPSTQGSGCPSIQNGIWGSAPQSTKNFWQFPVPAIDFSSLTSNLASIKTNAQASGIYLPPSNASGYSLVFKNNGTIDIYKITKLGTTTTGWDVNGVAHNEATDYKTRTLLYNKPVPSNGYIYIEDNTWVEGVVQGRVMLASAILPYNSSNAPTIYIPNNLTYTAKDGSSVLGLIAQNNIVVTYGAPTNLEIDSAMIAQNGSAQFFDYPNNIKTSITIYGSIMTFGQWTWSWVSGSNVVSGYTNTSSIYDGNLLYSPPPGFPFSASGYQQLTWVSN